MVRFINKGLKAHSCLIDEESLDILDVNVFNELTGLLTLHVRHLGIYSNSKLVHLLQKLTIQLGIERPTDFNFVLSSQKTKLKDLFLTLEIILESLYELIEICSEYFNDFVEDINEFFLIHKVPLQIRYLKEKKEFYVEKVISLEVSEKIGETLESFSGEAKVFEDFKDAVKKYSGGNYEGSIEKCCISLEDYFCIILGKQRCTSVVTYYLEVSKKFNISQELDDRFKNIVKYIQEHRSPQNHGAIEKKEFKDLELITEVIIQFTMTILNYLKKKKLLEEANK